jgi:hypothetical protein
MSSIKDLRKQIEVYFFVILIITATVYGLWGAYPLLVGPSITITSPQNDSTVASTTFQLIGTVTRVKDIRIQGRSIPIDKSGNFTEVLVAQAPFTIITITATDFYNKTITKTLRVIPEK